jgi:hypothetical protein
LSEALLALTLSLSFAQHLNSPSILFVVMSANKSVLAVGGNPVSAFLSWRLQATNACDVTLVWKSNFDAVAQYGISMK